MMRDKTIRIIDWCGRDLFLGDYDDPLVDKVLDANRCDCEEGCEACDQTGYSGDFEVYWEYPDNDKDNVYEYINY